MLRSPCSSCGHAPHVRYVAGVSLIAGKRLDPPAIHDFVADRRSDSDGPGEVMGDPHTHALEYLASQV
jgi:hypothetical protein